MLAVRFHATVGQTQTQMLGGQQQPWSSETRAQSVDRIGTRKMAIPAMANRIINVKRASDSSWPLPKTASLQASNVPCLNTCCASASHCVESAVPWASV